MLPRRLLGFTASPPPAATHCPCIPKAPHPWRLRASLAPEDRAGGSPCATSWVKYVPRSAQHLAGLLWHGEGAEAAGEPGRVAGAGRLGQDLLPVLLEDNPGQSPWGWWPSARAGQERRQSWLPTRHGACTWPRAMTAVWGPSGARRRSPKGKRAPWGHWPEQVLCRWLCGTGTRQSPPWGGQDRAVPGSDPAFPSPA